MEAEVTSMSLGGSSSMQMHCVTCGLSFRWTPRWWMCDVCPDYVLCENCHNGSEVLSTRPQVHNRDHHMSAHESGSRCDGCGSNPIWNLRWHCKVCKDFDLCDACHGGLDAVDMPLEHLKEHSMIAIEVICSDMLHQLRPSFTKPMDPKWSYHVKLNSQQYGFMWKKRKPMLRVLSGMDDSIIPTRGNAIEANSVPISKLEEQSTLNFGNSFIEQARQATQTHGMLDKDKKYKVFLSHAGTEKDFVEQLCRDLLTVHHFGIFFDKDDDSLPIGEPFPKRIFDAAKHCELAIVVISHEYFTRKWPMLELAAFVDAQKTRSELKILPVFYKLTVEEFKEQKHLFEECWNAKALVSKDEMDGWQEALKVISRTNGLEYDKRMGEPMFRDRIVGAVSKRVKPGLMWDDSHVQGKRRMQEKIKEIIQLPRNAIGEVLMVSTLCMGLFGMGGSGKSTMCKVWCNEMMPHFSGKVHHMEFGSVDVLQMRIKLLQSFCQLQSDLLQKVDEGQALNLMKEHIPKQRVCLVIDNVSHNQSRIDEAKILLNLPFKEGSLIVVTSRSSSILDTLKIERRLIMRIPCLATEEAKALFCHHAGCDVSSLTEEEVNAMDGFVKLCNFRREVSETQEYLPLALKVLGSQAGPKAEEWQKIKIDFKRCENESIHPIFSILRSSFDTLSLKYQRIFLDLSLTHNGGFQINIRDLKVQMRCLHDETDEKFVLTVVKDLEAKSLIDSYNVESEIIHVHDLYRKFARMEVENKGLQHGARCCFSRGRKGHHLVQEGRVRIYDHPISHITEDILSCAICLEAEWFIIQDCTKLVSVDVPRMENLRMFNVNGGCPQLIRVNLEGAVNLRHFYWGHFNGKLYPDLTSMESLEELWLKGDDVQSPVTPHGCLDFSKNSNLEKLSLSYVPLYMKNLGQVVSLKKLHLGNCQHLEKFEGLEALVHLEYACLGPCSSLIEFPSLAYFPYLEQLLLTEATKLKKIEGFANLIALRKLLLKNGMELKELPGIETCTRLEFLFLGGTSITNCSWISTMKDLKWLHLSGTKIRLLPDCHNLYKFSKLLINDCLALESIGDNTGSISPTLPQRLEELSARNCRSLNVLSKFHHESALRLLTLSKSSVKDVSSVVSCKQLQKLYCAETQITSLPDLGSLTRLEALDVHGCKLLTRMDNTKCLPALENLWVYGCTSLVALPGLRSSKRLTSISLFGCPLVEPNTVEVPTTSSIDMDMEDVVDNELEEDLEYPTLGVTGKTPLHLGPPKKRSRRIGSRIY